MTYMNESLGNKTLKQALNESLNKATPEDKKVMEETLDNLNIDYCDSEKESDNIDNEAANDNGAEMIKTLQESILAKQEAEAKITELQEKLSVCYAKEAKYEEDISKYKNAIRNLSESASKVKTLQSTVKNLTEQLSAKDAIIETKDNERNKLLENKKITANNITKLSENLSSKERTIKIANQKINQLNEQLKAQEQQFTKENNELQENYQTLKKDLKLKEIQYSNKLAKANSLVEEYRAKSLKAYERYIENKALVLGITAQEIKNRLDENYSFDDIDLVCENLENYSLRVNNLPFNLKNIKHVNLTEASKIPGSTSIINEADDVDDDLLRLANTLSN